MDGYEGAVAEKKRKRIFSELQSVQKSDVR